MLISTSSARGFRISIPSTPSSSPRCRFVELDRVGMLWEGALMMPSSVFLDSRHIGKACTMPESGLFKGFSADKDKHGAAAKIKVVVHNRPLNKREIAKKEDDIIMIEQNSDSLSIHETKLKLTEELSKVDEKLKLTKNLLETKNLEIKKINDEKKASMVVQFVAEATLRRVHAAQKDDDMPPIEAIFAPLEAELKLARQEIAKLQDHNRALDRLTKSKETALLDAERTVEFNLAKASMVDDLQNKNQELMKQIEICQEENMIPDKMHRQKVAEVEKLSQTVRELEEAVLAVVLPLM